MTPQPHFFYAGTWEDLERQERKYAEEEKIIVFTGSIGKTGAIGVDEVAVPQYMWKVIYFPQRSVDQYQCFLFPDSVEAVKPYTLYKFRKKRLKSGRGCDLTGRGLFLLSSDARGSLREKRRKKEFSKFRDPLFLLALS
jgi:DNA/RNA endonuclease G (NUC1)